MIKLYIPLYHTEDSDTADLELATKLQEEIQYEKEASEAASPVPEFVSEFQANGVWKVSPPHLLFYPITHRLDRSRRMPVTTR